MYRALIALTAALFFAIVAAVPANASNHMTKKQRRAASVPVFKRAALQPQASPLDAVLEDPKKASPASQPLAAWHPSPASYVTTLPLLSDDDLSFRRSPRILASVLLL